MLLALFTEDELADVEDESVEDPTLQIVQAWYRFSNWRFAWLNKLGCTQAFMEDFRQETKAVQMGIVNAMPKGHSQCGFRLNKFHSMEHFDWAMVTMGSVQVLYSSMIWIYNCCVLGYICTVNLNGCMKLYGICMLLAYNCMKHPSVHIGDVGAERVLPGRRDVPPGVHDIQSHLHE
jgi:hypothetical protein